MDFTDAQLLFFLIRAFDHQGSFQIILQPFQIDDERSPILPQDIFAVHISVADAGHGRKLLKREVISLLSILCMAARSAPAAS